MSAPDFSRFLDRLIADHEARADLRAADDEAEFVARSVTLAQKWSLRVSEEELKSAGRAAARRWMERSL